MSRSPAREFMQKQWRFHSATCLRGTHRQIDYLAPKDKLEGRAETILAARDAKLAAAREHRRLMRQQAASKTLLTDDRHRDILHAAGEAEASVAGEHLARNSRAGRRRMSVGGGLSKAPLRLLEHIRICPLCLVTPGSVAEPQSGVSPNKSAVFRSRCGLRCVQEIPDCTPTDSGLYRPEAVNHADGGRQGSGRV